MASHPVSADYPFVDIDELEIHAAADATWKRLLADIASARERLLVENFIYSAGIAGSAVSDAVLRASRNGAAVRVLVDAFGSKNFGEKQERRFAEEGIDLQFFNPLRLRRLLNVRRLLPRTHRRIIVVDDSVAWIGGLAFDDRWWPEGRKTPARDTMLRMTGAVVPQVAHTFELLRDGRMKERKLETIAAANPDQFRLLTQYMFRKLTYRIALRARIDAAEKRIWLAVPYFIPTVRLLGHLGMARRRGVEVRLLLPGRRTDHPAVRVATRRYYGPLLRTGVRIYEYQPSFLHAKVALFDDDWVVTGSHNLDHWSLRLNNELSVEIHSASATRQVAEQFESDLEHAREITSESWRRRPLWGRFLEHFFGAFDSAF